MSTIRPTKFAHFNPAFDQINVCEWSSEMVAWYILSDFLLLIGRGVRGWIMDGNVPHRRAA
jgi:hypothetical protein